MDFGTLLFFGFLWFVFNLLRRGGAESASRRPPPESHPLPPSTGLDSTQREGSRLEALLRDLNRGLEEAARASVDPPADEEEVEEERQSLEVEPETVSLETDIPRAKRIVVDQDDSAEQVVADRIAAAAARSGPQKVADHRRFDHRIRHEVRQEPADHTAVRSVTYTPKQLRDAMIWREILGPPVALRDE